MKKIIKFTLFLLILSACEDLIYKDQPLVLSEAENYKDWVDYRSAELGLYALQQELVDQIIVLGELRGDLLKVSSDADVDLVEIQNFDVSSDNKYASANNFYKLISACNALIRTLELNHPEVKESNPTANDYHRIYGEALCMRGWAYFNAARIYGRIPYIPEQLTDYQDVVEYIMNPELTYYVDSGRYMYDINGIDIIDLNDTVWYPMDTVYIDTVQFETFARRFVDLRTVVENVTYDLTERLNYVGVDYANKDGVEQDEWNAIIWTEYSKDYLLGQMALTVGNIDNAYFEYFYPILYNYDYLEQEDDYIRFGLDDAFSNDDWRTIFQNININEHIYTIWFGKSELQTHNLQRLFDNSGTNLFYLRPTSKAIKFWETEWIGQIPTSRELWRDNITELTYTGLPGDFSRGYGVSYIYKYGDGEDDIMSESEVRQMLDYKKNDQEKEVQNLMRNVDTLVYKYTRDLYDNDAFVPLYRASSVHLYAAEICLYFEKNGYTISRSPQFLNGTYNYNFRQLGVRGRVSLSEKSPEFQILQDPYTNEVIEFVDFVATSEYTEHQLKQRYFEEVILDERAKELAFEGERFYDLMRFAKRRGDPSFLADIIADCEGKYSSEKREEIRAKLMDENNWYIPFVISDNE